MVTEKKLTPFEISVEMEQYLETLKKNPNKHEFKQSLIRTGVLNKKGNTKKQICTGGYYVGK